MNGAARAKALLLVVIVSIAIPFAGHSGSFVNFETPIIHGLALSPDGKSLAACNLPDGRLEVYSVTESGLIGPVATVFVGLDPVSVRFQSSTEAWVVNHLSDSIAIVDIAGGKVTAILNTLESPEDVVFAGSPRRAFVSCSKANTIQTFDAVSHLEQQAIIIEGERPKAMCASPDGNSVYVAIFESGNSSTLLAPELTFLDNFPRASVVDMDIGPHAGVNPFPNLGALFDPPLSTNLTPSVPRRVSLIVKKDASGRWMDDSDGDWTEFVSGTNAFLSGRKPGWTILDHDVAMINTSNSTVRYIDGLMNICMDVAINPATGGINVVGTDARNEVRFEPVLKGIFSQVLLAGISADGSHQTVTDLNPHLSNSIRTLDPTTRKQSLGDPRGIVWNSRGTRVYITGMGSNNLRMLDADGNSEGLATDLEGGPSSIVYDENFNRLYVLGRFDGTVWVLDAETLRTISKVSMHDSTPESIKLGRAHFYNTQQTSGPGHLACASCHIDARFDRLAWDLGNPAGEMKIFSSTNRNFSIFIPPATNHFHPLKGPMVTQSLQDIMGHEPFHWRGDRDGLEDFNPTFEDLQGADSQLSPDQMRQFKDFLASIGLPPNRNRTFSNSLPATLKLKGQFALGRGQLARGAPLPAGHPAAGLDQFRATDAQGCVNCHTLTTGNGTDMHFANGRWNTIPPGPSGQHHIALLVTPRDENLPFKIPQLRSITDKLGFDLSGSTSRAGFGFFHDGRVDSLTRFLQDGFDFRDDQATADMIAFLMCFAGSDLPSAGIANINQSPGPSSQDVPASVGRQIAVVTKPSPSLVLQMISMARSPTGRVDLIVKGFLDSVPRGWVFNRSSGQFDSDLTDQRISTSNLAGLASPTTPLLYTVVPQGTGVRLGIDRDGDGVPDRTEIENGSDPLNPQSIPGNEAPVFDPLSDRLILAGKSIVFTVTASDSATQSITFGLRSFSTPGATIDARSGAFAWQVPTNQAPGICSLQFIASDNGFPALTNTLSINLQVVTNIPPPRFLKIGRNDNAVFLDWQAVSGAIYLVEQAEDLEANEWSEVKEAISTDGLGHVSDLTISESNRFYRVRVK